MNIQGLMYPDDFFIKFFFKHDMQLKKGQTYLELGCSNGCNLTLPYQFANNVIGVDMDETLIGFANNNFNSFTKKGDYIFSAEDMRSFCAREKNIYADVLVLANSIYYISKSELIELFENIRNNNLIKKNILLFIRFRELDDFRNKKGIKVEENSYILDNGITGEDGVFCRFYDTYEMVDILHEHLDLRDSQIMKIRYDNIQKDKTVNCSDVVIWGKIN